MNKKLALLAVVVLSVGLMTNAYAHKSHVVGNYKMEVGWKNEPPIVGKKNAIEITVTKASSTDKKSSDHGSHDEAEKTTKTSYDESSAKIMLVSSSKSGSENKHNEKSHTHSAKKSSGISGLSKTLEADVTLNGKKTFLKLTEDKKNKGTYYGQFTPDSEGHPTVHVVGKIKKTPVELTFHPEKVEPEI